MYENTPLSLRLPLTRLICPMRSREFLLSTFVRPRPSERVKVKRDCHNTLRLASSSCIPPRSSCACLLRSARSTSAVAARAAQYRATDESVSDVRPLHSPTLTWEKGQKASRVDVPTHDPDSAARNTASGRWLVGV